MLEKLVLIIALNVLSALCYIPAVPSNDTEKITAGLTTNVSEATLSLHWFSMGFITLLLAFSYNYLTHIYRSYTDKVLFQLAGNGSTGTSRVTTFPLWLRRARRPFLNHLCRVPWSIFLKRMLAARLRPVRVNA